MGVISTDTSHSSNLVDPSNKSQGPQGTHTPHFENHLPKDTMGFPEITLRIYKFCISFL